MIKTKFPGKLATFWPWSIINKIKVSHIEKELKSSFPHGVEKYNFRTIISKIIAIIYEWMGIVQKN